MHISMPERAKFWATAGHEFGDSEGYMVFLLQALCGLNSSGTATRSHFAQSLRDLGYASSRGCRSRSMAETNTGTEWRPTLRQPPEFGSRITANQYGLLRQQCEVHGSTARRPHGCNAKSRCISEITFAIQTGSRSVGKRPSTKPCQSDNWSE